MTRTLLQELPDGTLYEFRRLDLGPGFCRYESRELRKDGRPHNDNWYPVEADHLLALGRATDILDLLDHPTEPTL